ncbi:MAG: VCBS repeat-containing protein [Planctomycetota bacterium]
MSHRPLAALALTAGLLPSVALGQLGTPYCPGAPNSTGAGARLAASGSPDPADNDVMLRAEGLPVGSVGYVLAARDFGFTQQPGGSMGDLCLGGPIGRYSQSVLTAGPSGAVALAIDITRIPHPAQPFGVVAGDTVRFQYWYRDTTPAGATSNLSGGLAVHFCPGQLFSQERLAAGETPFDLARGDFDHDGDVDFAVTEHLDGTVSVRLGDGRGTFAEPVRYPIAGLPRELVAADFDADGDLDLAAVSLFGVVTVLGGRGDGTFDPPAAHAVGSSAWAIVAGDLDGDGDIDLVTSSAAGPSLWFLFNPGDGAFAPSVELPLADPPGRLALGDLDGDGDLDLVAGTSAGVQQVENQGGGAFAATSVYALTAWPWSLALADFDGDGDLDLAAASEHDGRVELLENQLAVLTPRAPVAVMQNVGAIGADDLDNDGRVDLIVVGDSAGQLVDSTAVSCQNLGGFMFRAPARFGLIGAEALALEVVDVDGDGARDLLVANGSGGVSVLIADGAGGVTPDLEERLPAAANQTLIGDVDGDGDVDVVLVGAAPLGLSVLSNLGTGDLAPPAHYPLAGLFATGELVDLDVDGDLDLVVWDTASAEVHVFTNPGNGVFGAPNTTVLGPGPMDLALGDVDGDGDLDAVVATGGGMSGVPGEVLVLSNQGSAVLAITGRVTVGGWPVSIALVDLDADGDLDVGFTNVSVAALSLDVLANDGLGGFGARTSVALIAPRIGHALVPGDVDGDGDVDLLLTVRETATNYVLTNLGNGGVAVSAPMGMNSFGGDSDLVDLDGDSDLDLLAQRYDRMLVQLNAGDGTFGAIREFAVSSIVRSFGVADVDGDSDADLVTAQDRVTHGLLVVRRGLCR